jgi:hypothetical protein
MSRNLLLATLVQDSSGDIAADRFDKLVDNTIEPETLNMAVDVDSAGHGADWKWSWKPTTLPYARENITMLAQNEVPVYKSGTYSLINFTAFRMRDSATQTHKMYLKWIDEPGLSNLVDWVTYDSGNFTFEGVTGDSATRAQRLRWTVPSSYTIPTLNTSTTNYNIGAVSGAYVHTGTQVGQNAAIQLRRGNTYNFVLDATTVGHPFYLSTDDGSGFITNTYVNEYLHGVTNSRGTNGTVTFVVPDSAPSTMTYQCGVHSAMRGNITIKDLKTDSNGAGQDIIYFQHSQEGHATESPVKEVPTIVGQMCLTFDAAKGKYVPQDMRDYMEKTTSFTQKIREEIKSQAIDSDKTLGLLRTKNILDNSNVFTASSGLDSAKVTSLVQTSIIDSDYVATKLGFTNAASSTIQKEQNTTFVQDGTLTINTGTARWYSPRAVTITKIRKHVATAPVGAALNMTLKKNGSSIQTFSIADGGSTNVTNNLNLSVAEGDYLTVDITQIGSTTAGSDLNIVISYK